jgi:leucyl aminopeptidase (aminopeptidase T)
MEQSGGKERPEIGVEYEQLENARRLIKDYLKLDAGQRALFIVDEQEVNTDLKLIEKLKEAMISRGIETKEIKANDSTKLGQIEKEAKDCHVIWQSQGLDKAELDWDGFVEFIEKTKKKLAYCPGVKVESLENDGALSEDLETLDHRLEKMEQRLRDLRGLHVTTTYGTDLLLPLRQGERQWIKDNGVIEEGRWDNLPGGEIFTTPDEREANGLLVLPVLQDEVAPDQGVDEFVRLTIRNGRIAKIDGGKSAETLRQYLQERSKEETDPESVLSIAEVAFGANSKARQVVTDPKGGYEHPGNPTIETEKRLGTMHIAFGSSQHGEEGAEGYNVSEVHLDFVIPRNGLTVTGYKDREDFKKLKNGERLIDEGRLNFF